MMCCKKYPLSSSEKKLTKAQKTLIRKVWNDVREKIDEVGVETFLMFFNTHPEAMDSFLVFKDMQLKDLRTSVKLKEHSLKVTSIVDKCVSRLDDMDAVATVAAEQGVKHAGRYVIPEFQKCLKESYINAIRTRTTIPWTSATQHAWNQTYLASQLEAAAPRYERKVPYNHLELKCIMLCCSIKSNQGRFTKSQKSIIREVWSEAKKDIDTEGWEIYSSTHSLLESRKISLQETTSSALSRFHTHIKLMSEVVDACVAKLDDLKALDRIAESQGVSHASRYILPGFQREIRLCFISMVRDRSRVNWNKKYQKAWDHFFTYFQTRMTLEMEKERSKLKFLISFA